MFSLKGISTCNFTLIFKFHMSSAFHLFIVQTANSKYESWWKLLMEVRQWTNIVIMVIQFPRVTLCIAWSYFNLQFNLITYFICPQLFILFIVQTANSKYESWLKLLMEVCQWTNIVIMVIQFPSVTLCFAWKLFQLAISLSFSNFIWPQLFILFIVQIANSKYESWLKLLMEVCQWTNIVIMVIQFPSVTLCFAWKLFQLAISLSFSNFIWPQLFILFIVQIANSKYESWLKLLMEVRQWTNIVIMVIQFPRVTLCIAWSYFNLQFNLITYFICPQLFIYL